MSENDNNEQMDGFLGAEITVEDQAFGSAYPVLQWVNGDKSKKKIGGIVYTGGWFLAADAGLEPPAGFEEMVYTTSDGNDVHGFGCRDLTFSPIQFRRCWLSTPNEGLPRRFGWNEYDDASAFGQIRGVTHIIAGIEGVDEPVLLAFRGMVAKSMLGQGRERGIIPQYGARVIRAADSAARKNHKTNKKHPLCAFKLNVGPQRDGDGEPTFTEVGSGQNKSKITLPVWLDEPQGIIDLATLNRLYVGNETFATYQDWHRETEEWSLAWRAENLAPKTGGSSVGAPPADAEASGTPGNQEMPF